MLSNGFEIPIRLDAVPSRLYFYFILLVHALAMIAMLYPSSINSLLRGLMAIGVIISCIYHLTIQLRADRWVWIWQQSGLWLGEQDGFQVAWRLHHTFSETYWFIAIRLVNDLNQKQDLLLLRDQLDADSFRRLRVRLRFAQVDATRPGETI